MSKLLSIQEILKSKWPTILQNAFGDNLVSAFLHGSCLMEGFSALRSPWTVSFILQDNAPDRLDRIRGLAKQAQRENIQFRYFFSPVEIVQSLDIFPLEYLHIANRNAPLCGIQPLAGYIPQRECLRLQCERELRGILVHLRKEFVNAPSGRAKDEFFRSLQEDTFPILYGVYYLETGSYPENHKQILERYPSLDCADFIETITGILDKVDSMEE